MDYTVESRISYKPGVLDAEGETIQKSLGLLGYEAGKVEAVKVYRIKVSAESEQKAIELVKSASDKLLANSVIQDYEVTVV